MKDEKQYPFERICIKCKERYVIWKTKMESAHRRKVCYSCLTKARSKAARINGFKAGEAAKFRLYFAHRIERLQKLGELENFRKTVIK